MIKLNISSILPSAALALALVSTAGATTVTLGNAISVPGEGLMSLQPGAVTTTFDGLTAMPSNFIVINTTPAVPLVQGSSTNVYLAPTGDTSTYVSVGTGAVLDILPAGITYFGFDWGSVDAYNDFEISQSDGTTLDVNGAALAAAFAVPADGVSSYFVNFFADPGTTFTAAGFSSSVNSFEFDNVATATPEPGTLAMLAGGLLIVIGTLRRRTA